MIEPNILAFQNGALLAALAEPPAEGWSITGLAEHLDRDDSNLGKTLKGLRDKGLLLDPPLSGLTDEGKVQLAAFNRARHGGERRKAQGRWAIDQLRPNPSNRRITATDVEGMADAIVGAGGVLMPLVLSPPDANGVRTIWAGERRWRAALLLADRGELPDELTQGLPFTEREATPGEAALIAVIENTARKDLTPWEDAKLLKQAADGLGLTNASELARRIGRARDGDRGGLRDVQDKLKIANTATTEQIADYEAKGSWDDFRDQVLKRGAYSEKASTPQSDIVTTKAQRLALAELWRKAERTFNEVAVLPSAHVAEGARLAQYGLAILSRSDKGDTARITQAGVDYLKVEGLDGSIENTRERLGFPAGYGVQRLRTEWLNTPGDEDPWRSGGTVHVSTKELPRGHSLVIREASLSLFKQMDGFTPRYRARLRVELNDRTLYVNQPIPGPSTPDLAYQMAIEDFLKHEWPQAPRALIEWADRFAGPFVVAGKNHHNASRAQEARYALGWDQRKSNSGGGLKQALQDLAADDAAPGDEDAAETTPVQLDEAEPADAPPAAVMSAHLRQLASSTEHPTNAALRLIAEERRRQVEAEGYTPEKDDEQNGDGEMALAAAAYAASAAGDPDAALFWPGGWDPYMFKPRDEVRDLVRAATLIVAELERHARQMGLRGTSA